MLTRRTLLSSAAPLALSPLVFKPALAGGIGFTVPVYPPPSNAVIGAAKLHFNHMGMRLSLGQLIQSDVNTAVEYLELLIANFFEAGVDPQIAAASKAVNPASVDFINSPVIDTAYTNLIGAGAAVTRAQVQLGLNKNMPSSQIPSQISSLQSVGVTGSMSKISTQLKQYATILPVSYDPKYPAHLRTVMTSPFCDMLNWWAGLLGVAAFELGLGCLPEPFFLVICPAVAILAIIAAIVGLMAWVFC
jgi:hypothetical protein